MAEKNSEKTAMCDDSPQNATRSVPVINNNKQKPPDGGGMETGVGGTIGAVDDKEKFVETQKVQPTMVSVATPLLIEDINGEQMPVSYSKLLEHLAAQSPSEKLTASDIIVLFVYIIMLEEGFVPAHCAEEFNTANISFNHQQVIQLSTRIAPNWKRANNIYEFAFVFACLQPFVCKLLCSTCMNDLIINCKIYGVTEGNYSMIVDPAQYIVESRTHLLRRYQNIKQFAMNFKNTIGNPAKNDILQANDLQSPSLLGLPVELKMHLEKMANQNIFQNL